MKIDFSYINYKNRQLTIIFLIYALAIAVFGVLNVMTISSEIVWIVILAVLFIFIYIMFSKKIENIYTTRCSFIYEGNEYVFKTKKDTIVISEASIEKVSMDTKYDPRGLEMNVVLTIKTKDMVHTYTSVTYNSKITPLNETDLYKIYSMMNVTEKSSVNI